MKLRLIIIETYEIFRPQKTNVSITHQSRTVPLNNLIFDREQNSFK